MSVSVPTLDRIRNLEQLYRSGYRSPTVDAAIDKLLSVEMAKAREEAKNLYARLVELEATYGIPSAEFMRRFQAGKMGDSADMFEWSAFYQMWVRVTTVDGDCVGRLCRPNKIIPAPTTANIPPATNM